LMTRRFEPGALLSIEIRTRDGANLTLLAHVVRVHAAGRNRSLWSLGCCLPAPLGDDDLEELVETPQSAWLKSKRILLAAVEEVVDAVEEQAGLDEMPTLELVLPDEPGANEQKDSAVLDEVTLAAVLSMPLRGLGLANIGQNGGEISQSVGEGQHEPDEEVRYWNMLPALAEECAIGFSSLDGCPFPAQVVEGNGSAVAARKCA
ncbi:MAG: hypothetical protein AB7K24_33965, partial [Gemmataceae bacterium]